MQILIGVAHLHGQLELLLQLLWSYVLHPRIQDNLQRLALALTTYCQFDGIVTRQSNWALRTLITIERAGDAYRRFPTQIPGIAVHARRSRDGGNFFNLVRPLRRLFKALLFLAGKTENKFPGFLQNSTLYFISWSVLEVVANDCSCRRIVSNRSPAVHLVWVMQPERVFRLKQDDVTVCRSGIDLTQRRDIVQDPKRTSVGGRN